jgi:hypothetical protein
LRGRPATALSGVPILIFSAGLFDVIKVALSCDPSFSDALPNLVDGGDLKTEKAGESKSDFIVTAEPSLPHQQNFGIISNRCVYSDQAEGGELVLALSEPTIHVFNKRCKYFLEVIT